MTVNREKLLALPNEQFVKIVALLELLPIQFPQNGEHKNKAMNAALQKARNYTLEYIDDYPSIDNTEFQTTVQQFFGLDSSARLELLKKTDLESEENLINHEQAIELFSNSWLNKPVKNPEKFDKQVFLEGKSSLKFDWLTNQNSQVIINTTATAQQCAEFAQYIKDRFHIKTLSFNSFESPQELFNKLSTLHYCFESIIENLNISPKNIGFDKLHLSIGRLNDDCNGWMGGDSIVLTQKANETILTHEWMHFFDAKIQADMKPKVAQKWESLVNEILKDDYAKNKFDMALFKNLDPKSFINRFVSNHVKPEHKTEFSEALSVLNENLASFVQKVNSQTLNSQELQNNFGLIKLEQQNFYEKYNSQEYFPDDNFLHRYMSFLKADFQLMEDIVNNKITSTKSVFAEHAARSDENFGHHYSGNREEMIARSFEAYLDDNANRPMPLSTRSNLWYPVEKERQATNQMWSNKIVEMRYFLGNYTPPDNSLTSLSSPLQEAIKNSLQANSVVQIETNSIKLNLAEKRENNNLSKKSEKNYTNSSLSGKINKHRNTETDNKQKITIT